MPDFTTPHGQRATERLHTEEVIWLTTIGGDGTPQPSPVWFLWEENTVLIFSEPKTPKVANIRRSPKVALHFDSDGEGGDIVVITGEAAIISGGPVAMIPAAYTTKYARGLKDIKMTADEMAAQFSAAIRVTPTKLRGH